jgi:hypothetical protein
MTQNTALRAGLAFLIFVLGSLQAWDSNVPEAGLWIVLLVSLAIPLAPIALLIPVQQSYMVGAIVLSFLILLAARMISPIPLPGLFIILVPAAMGLIFAGLIKQDVEDAPRS